MNSAPFRRIVTGHDVAGQAIIQEDAPPARVQRIGGETGPLFYEIWNTRATPAPIDRASGEPHEDGIMLAPPSNGTRIRVLDIPPEGDNLDAMSAEDARRHFEEIGAADASSHTGAGSRHAYMHRTETVDYGIVLEGEITLIMDEGETTVRAGDIVVQRGTNHGWANRSEQNCRIAFILIDGKFEDGLS
jgi:mannose-6-phosphate isomerase-like protein (cupin superfamily)